ncbi:uncharacterized protein TrAtP1_012004 [Trichoderma atroviride]|uniref:uncharacterized protein n=1 Tax=Hypocrea atroviridis TaxID=63577 RepID=UPI00332EEE38|nr:hypothetical protein TrAtP1_012004 [Trichoderma atroviride]
MSTLHALVKSILDPVYKTLRDMTFKKIVLAGASGNLGACFLRNLLESADHVFQVTVLTRSKTNGAESFLSAAGLPLSSPNKPSVVSVDCDDHPALVQSLKGHDVVIAAIAEGYCHAN